MIGYIYCTTNKINGKKYIGRHEASEFEPEKYIGSGTLLIRAINKYGRENFSCELIEACETVQSLADREKYWIEFYDATNNPMYYNLSEGGLGSCGEVCSKIIKDLWKDPEYRQKHVEGSKRRWQDLEYRQKHIDAFITNLHQWTDEERAAHSEKEKQSWKNPELLERHRQICKNLWTDDKRQSQRERNQGSKNPSYGKTYMTDGQNNWIFSRPEDAPEGFHKGTYVFIVKDGVKKRHDKSLPIPEDWDIFKPKPRNK